MKLATATGENNATGEIEKKRERETGEESVCDLFKVPTRVYGCFNHYSLCSVSLLYILSNSPTVNQIINLLIIFFKDDWEFLSNLQFLLFPKFGFPFYLISKIYFLSLEF